MTCIISKIKIFALGIVASVAGIVCISIPAYARTYNVNGFYIASPMSVGSDYSLADSVLPKLYAETTGSFPFNAYRRTLFNNLVSTPDNDGICQYSYMWPTVVADQYNSDFTNFFYLGFPTVVDTENQRTCFEYKTKFTDSDGNNPLNVDSIPNNPLLDWVDYGFQSDRDFYMQFLRPYYYRQSGWLLRSQHGSSYTEPLNFYKDIVEVLGTSAPLNRLELPLIVPDLEDCWVTRRNVTYLLSGWFDLGSPDYFTDYSDLVDDENSNFSVRVVYYTTDDGNGSAGTTYEDYPLDYSFVEGVLSNELHFTGEFNLNSYYLEQYDFFTIELFFDFKDSNGDKQPLWSSRSLSFNSITIRDNFDGDDGVCNVGENQSGNSVGGVYNDPHEGDWLYQLKNLFSFGFVNPFIPMFNLFTDGSQCVQIPTIASMLHFQEGQVCPFFDSSTRAIVTPVFAMVAMIILVSFIYRWLSSSSGNFTSDSDSKNNGGV